VPPSAATRACVNFVHLKFVSYVRIVRNDGVQNRQSAWVLTPSLKQESTADLIIWRQRSSRKIFHCVRKGRCSQEGTKAIGVCEPCCPVVSDPWALQATATTAWGRRAARCCCARPGMRSSCCPGRRTCASSRHASVRACPTLYSPAVLWLRYITWEVAREGGRALCGLLSK